MWSTQYLMLEITIIFMTETKTNFDRLWCFDGIRCIVFECVRAEFWFGICLPWQIKYSVQLFFFLVLMCGSYVLFFFSHAKCWLHHNTRSVGSNFCNNIIKTWFDWIDDIYFNFTMSHENSISTIWKLNFYQ